MVKTLNSLLPSLLIAAFLLLAACAPEPPVFTDADSVREAQAAVHNARFTASMTAYTEASDDRWSRTVTMDWMDAQAVGDSTVAK